MSIGDSSALKRGAVRCQKGSGLSEQSHRNHCDQMVIKIKNSDSCLLTRDLSVVFWLVSLESQVSVFLTDCCITLTACEFSYFVDMKSLYSIYFCLG